MPTPTGFEDTLPAPRTAAYIPVTPAENAAYNAGRKYQRAISLVEGASMARLSWFCWGVMAGVALLGGLQACGAVQ